jgi:hypothetical protein
MSKRTEFYDWPPRRGRHKFVDINAVTRGHKFIYTNATPPRRMVRPRLDPNVIYFNEDEEMPRRRTWLNSRAGTRFADFVFGFGLFIFKVALGFVLGLVLVISLFLLVAILSAAHDTAKKPAQPASGTGSLATIIQAPAASA